MVSGIAFSTVFLCTLAKVRMQKANFTSFSSTYYFLAFFFRNVGGNKGFTIQTAPGRRQTTKYRLMILASSYPSSHSLSFFNFLAFVCQLLLALVLALYILLITLQHLLCLCNINFQLAMVDTRPEGLTLKTVFTHCQAIITCMNMPDWNGFIIEFCFFGI